MSQLPHLADTIAALASAAGGAARGIVRVSGPRAVACFEGWFLPTVTSSELPDSARLPSAKTQRPSCTSGALSVAGLGRPLPVDLYLWPGRRSYTGEPLAELHTLGSPPLLEAVLADVFSRGIRPAQPGEFTLRAFLAGRLDLVQAEAVLGVIDARGRAELQQALEQLGGGVSSPVIRLRGELLDLLADLEAGLDFSEEDIEFVSYAMLIGRIGLARDAVADLIGRAGSRLRSGVQPRVVLAGPPNAGKSTLYNALVGAYAAIVSPECGTTRDYLVANVCVHGASFTLVDTAGSESAGDSIAVAAQQLRREQLALADLVVWCLPADTLTKDAIDPAEFGVPEERLLVVVTKTDLVTTALPLFPAALHSVSAQSGAGLDTLRSAIVSRLAEPASDPHSLLGTTAARCHDSLHGALKALDRALGIARNDADQELLAIELRESLDELGKIVGAVYTDDILDRIFSKFCVGK